MKKLLLIVNPVTAKAVMSPVLIDIIDLFEDEGYSVATHISKSKGEVVSFVANRGSKYDVVVCAGGDGTLNETVTGALMIAEENRPKLGYIPSGTTNDFATSWNIPKRPLDAARLIANGTAKKTDISTFCGRPFVYVSAFGAFTTASYSTPQELKKSLGWAAYIIEGIKSIPTIRPWHMKVEYDGGEVSGDFLYGMVSNTKRVGGFDLKMKSQISISDGLMELILIRKPENPADNPRLIAAVLAQDITSEFITFAHTKHITFTADEDLPWTVDGEPGGAMRSGQADILAGAVELFHK